MECLVIGLGVLGKSIAVNLAQGGVEVTGVDISEESLQEIAAYLKEGLRLDATIEENLKYLGIEKFDIIFVCIGVNVQASLLITWQLKKLGARRIISRSNSAIHSELLEKLGADRVIMPEIEMGKKIAIEVITNFEDFFALSDNLLIVKIPVSEKLVKKTLRELDIRKKYNINVIAIEKRVVQTTREEEKVQTTNVIIPNPDDRFEPYDLIYIIGSKENIKRFKDENK